MPRLLRQGRPRVCVMCCCCSCSCSCCRCRCSAPAMVLLLCMLPLLLLLLLLLLCLRYVFAADLREHGYCACQPLSVACLRIFKLKDGPICFGSCTSTVSQLTFIWRLGGGLAPACCSCRMMPTCTTCTLYCRCCLLPLSHLHQRNRRRFVLSINSTDCCATNCFVYLSVHEVPGVQYRRTGSRT